MNDFREESRMDEEVLLAAGELFRHDRVAIGEIISAMVRDAKSVR